MGYQSERIFVPSIPNSRKAGDQWRPDAYRVPQAACQPERDASPFAGGDSSTSVVNCDTLNKEAVRQQLLGSFLNRIHPEKLSGPSSVHWMSVVSIMKTGTYALDFGVFALCTARLGRKAKDGEEQHLLTRASADLYGRALSAMQKAIKDPQLVQTTETLCACWLLAMYEVFECPNKTNEAYRSHIDGCKRLIELRGPEAHQTGVGHAVLLAFRTNAVRMLFYP